jgi:hypothetical protein
LAVDYSNEAKVDPGLSELAGVIPFLLRRQNQVTSSKARISSSHFILEEFEESSFLRGHSRRVLYGSSPALMNNDDFLNYFLRQET